MKGLKKRLQHRIFERLFEWRLQEFVRPHFLMLLEYWPELESRYGEGKPAHPEIAAMFGVRDAHYRAQLESFLPHRKQLRALAEAAPADPREPFWENIWLTGMDAVALYGVIAAHKPALYFEVGSGNSTRLVRRAIADQGLRTRIVSLDPSPRADIDDLCDEVMRARLEQVDTTVFSRLESGDVLFIDNSHRVFQGGDVAVFFMEILPRLKPGVIVHIHDIFLPFDYPAVWKTRYYSEQYMLAAYLLGGARNLEVLLPIPYLEHHAVLGPHIAACWNDPVFVRAFAHNRKLTGYIGTSFWLRTL